ncbi:leader peptidase (prepilin peptidase)/N-methyltransferase [Aequitasia blattaphilus]|uniref:Prepilin peptidase n=1 Tax=Aequitasia blattaphilus TaxID=2949332 RepID=A0ABT1E7W5_9FIRM|nr:A24 family peptidase [Aequitasia blattaphilus]MCP1101914.1 prepilin peptidase [Aequitasia blattaphilus]MCR8614554.1 prepilin peptidase [Aequitasia blattaphilus]
MAIIYLLIFMMGASVFSFLNVLIYRVPRKMNYVSGRSMCPSCEHELNFLDMVPVFGWIFLGGKCRYCKEKISSRYMLIEALGGGFSVYFFYLYKWSIQTLFVFVLFALLTLIAFVDIDTMEIPNGFVVFGLLLSLVSWVLFPGLMWYERIIGIFSAALILLIITLIVPGAFGGGDIKMMAAFGILLGWKMSLLALFLAVLMGGIYGIVLLIRKKVNRKDHFAFGPFLCIGVGAAFLWGGEILRVYLSIWSL